MTPIASLSIPRGRLAAEFLAPTFSLMDALQTSLAKTGGSLHIHTHERDEYLVHDFYDAAPPGIPTVSMTDLELDELVGVPE